MKGKVNPSVIITSDTRTNVISDMKVTRLQILRLSRKANTVDMRREPAG